MEYNDLIYNSGPVKFHDYINDKYNIVHNKLYEYALNQYVYSHVSNIILENILYSLFICMNNCITEYNDIDQIINEENIPDNIYFNNSYHVYTIQEVNDHNICNEDYIIKLINYIKQSKYNDDIISTFSELYMEDEVINYIKFIVANIVILIKTLSYDIKSVFIKNNLLNENTDDTNISNFIIRYDNVIYIMDEEQNILTSETLIESQPEYNEVFILENQIMSNIHIGFNSNGKFIIDIDPSIDINDIYDTVYFIIETINNILFNTLFYDINSKYIDTHKIIEKKNVEYWMPSSIIVFDKIYPHKKHVIDLTPYWSMYQDSSNISFIDKKIINESLNDSEIEYINYVNGEINMYSKLHDIHYKVPTKYIDSNTNINDNLIKGTFINKYKNFD